MRLLILLLASLLCAMQAASGAENWPGNEAAQVRGGIGGSWRPTRHSVPRELSDYLSQRPSACRWWSRTGPGAGGNIAAAVGGHRPRPTAAPFWSPARTQAVNPALLPNPGFDYQRDLVLGVDGGGGENAARRVAGVSRSQNIG